MLFVLSECRGDWFASGGGLDGGFKCGQLLGVVVFGVQLAGGDAVHEEWLGCSLAVVIEAR